jgi:hypothetical protein
MKTPEELAEQAYNDLRESDDHDGPIADRLIARAQVFAILALTARFAGQCDHGNSLAIRCEPCRALGR